MEMQKVILRRKNLVPPQVEIEPEIVNRKERGFLCLTRRLKPNQDIVLINDGDMEIQILSIKGNTVRLGFRATKDFRIERPEKV